MALEYVHPPVDNVPEHYWVDPQHEGWDKAAVNTVEEGIGLYMEAFRSKFESQLHAQRREWNLGRFVNYLESCGHSLLLDELTLSDGQGFLDQLVSARNGSSLTLAKKKQYRSALRSLSRFLHNAQFMEENVFFRLTLR